jgi:hypothetical protein
LCSNYPVDKEVLSICKVDVIVAPSANYQTAVETFSKRFNMKLIEATPDLSDTKEIFGGLRGCRYNDNLKELISGEKGKKNRTILKPEVCD